MFIPILPNVAFIYLFVCLFTVITAVTPLVRFAVAVEPVTES